jgi:ABC-type sugar transport system ATPase subunit
LDEPVELHKSFGQVKALDGLDLAVQTGQVAGFLGPNGAGKSTTIRVLLGLLRPDAGSVEVLGLHPWDDAVELHRRLAYVPGDVSLWPNLTGGEAIDLLCRLRGGADKARKAELLDRFELDPTKKGRTYSLVRTLAPSIHTCSTKSLGVTSPAASRVRRSTPTARTSGSANGSSMSRRSARVAITRAAAAMVAVAPTLDARSQVSPSYLVEVMFCPIFLWT